MRIMTWNVRSAPYDAIAPIVTLHRPDVLVLPECREPSDKDLDLLAAADHRWRGSLPKKGLGVFILGNVRIAPGAPSQPEPPMGYRPCDDPLLDQHVRPWVLPVELNISRSSTIRLVGVWASNRKAYRPLTAALEAWGEWLSGGPLLVVGDFNHHAKWDRKRNPDGDIRNHQYTERLLRERYNVVSAFHHSRRGPDGVPPVESPTYWHWYRESLGHHIDYVYAPRPWILEGDHVTQIGGWSEFAAVGSRISDHAPLVCDLEPPA